MGAFCAPRCYKGLTMAQPKDKPSSATPAAPKKHTGSCHCGAIRFEVAIDLTPGVSRCNCSICTKTATTNGIVKPGTFTLLQGEDRLGIYEWGPKTSRRYFCTKCGVHCFGRGHLEEVGGDYVSVNVNTLDDVELTELTVVYWDGRHDEWQKGPRKTPWPLGPRIPS